MISAKNEIYKLLHDYFCLFFHILSSFLYLGSVAAVASSSSAIAGGQHNSLAIVIDMILKSGRRNQAAIFVFLYNVLSGIPVKMAVAVDGGIGGDNDNDNIKNNNDLIITIDKLNSMQNAAAYMNGGYVCDESLWSLCECFRSTTIQTSDFGITVLMLYFAHYYAREQYALYVEEFRCIKELAVIERFLLSYNQTRIKLPLNLSIHPKYGLKRQAHRFVNSNHLTMTLFETMIAMMQQSQTVSGRASKQAVKRTKLQHSMADIGAVSSLTPDMFIDFVSMFHVRIIESFYIFTSISKNCKIIYECSEFMNVNKLEYTFQKPIKTDNFTLAEYFFQIPSGALWFAYYQGKIKFSSYAGNELYSLFKVFDVNKVMCVVVGFIDTSNNTLTPLIFEDLHTDWTRTIAAINYLKLHCVFRPISEVDVLLKKNKAAPRFYFVKAGIAAIFKYDP